MGLSAPIYMLKRSARMLARKERIPLHAALDRVAAQEGFAAWSLLVAQAPAAAPATRLFAQLSAGDLVLLGARPGHGKTLMSLKLAVEAMKAGRQSVFFSLEYVERDVLDRFRAIGVAPADFDGLFGFDNSDDISAEYIIAALSDAPRGTLVVVDYLQLLDQKRGHPGLGVQVRALQAFARRQELVFVFISQIDRKYDPSAKPCPDLDDIRLPNPVDLSPVQQDVFSEQRRGEISGGSDLTAARGTARSPEAERQNVPLRLWDRYENYGAGIASRLEMLLPRMS